MVKLLLSSNLVLKSCLKTLSAFKKIKFMLTLISKKSMRLHPFHEVPPIKREETAKNS